MTERPILEVRARAQERSGMARGDGGPRRSHSELKAGSDLYSCVRSTMMSSVSFNTPARGNLMVGTDYNHLNLGSDFRFLASGALSTF